MHESCTTNTCAHLHSRMTEAEQERRSNYVIALQSMSLDASVAVPGAYDQDKPFQPTTGQYTAHPSEMESLLSTNY